MNCKINHIEQIKENDVYVTVLELEFGALVDKIEVLNECSYIIKSTMGNTGSKARIEMISAKPMRSAKLAFYDEFERKIKRKRIWLFHKYLAHNNAQDSRILDGNWNEELYYHIDNIEYLPTYDIAQVTGWAFHRNGIVEINGIDDTTFLSMHREERNDVSKAFACEKEVGFKLYVKGIGQKGCVGLSFSCMQLKIEIGILAADIDHIDDAELARRKVESYYGSMPYQHQHSYKETAPHFAHSIDVIVACNQEKWIKNIVAQIEKAADLSKINFYISVNQKNYDRFEEVLKDCLHSPNLQGVEAKELFICSDAVDRNELRMAGVHQSKSDLLVFMDQEDSIEPELFSHFQKTMTPQIVVGCTDYDLVYGDKKVIRISRTSHSWRRENPDLILNACCIRVKRLRNILRYDDLIKVLLEKTIQSDQCHIDGFIGYHYNCVEDSWRNIEENVKSIAFYLPQFHENEENNKWWGKGFTEWSNVKRARPMFEGHHQPRIPGELGYYDLVENKDIMQNQVKLAKDHGLFGFCFYYYWFNGKRLLKKPVDLFVANKDIDMPYCICWANESWTRRWDGLEKEVLIQQNHTEETDILFIRDVIPLMLDERYIRVNGKPLLLIYRMDLLPEPLMTAQRWRQICIQEGVGEIHISSVQSFDNVSPVQYGADSAVEFPPHKLNLSNHVCLNNDLKIQDGFVGNIYSYKKIVENLSTIFERDYLMYPGSMVEWDNTARRMENANIFAEFEPDLFRTWNIKNQFYSRLYNYQNDKLIFINAWNEWAEGSYLEPDQKYGTQMLEIVKEVAKLK